MQPGQKGTGSLTSDREENSSQPADLCSTLQHEGETLPIVCISILQEPSASCLEGFLSGVCPVTPNPLSSHKILNLEL